MMIGPLLVIRQAGSRIRQVFPSGRRMPGRGGCQVACPVPPIRGRSSDHGWGQIQQRHSYRLLRFQSPLFHDGLSTLIGNRPVRPEITGAQRGPLLHKPWTPGCETAMARHRDLGSHPVSWARPRPAVRKYSIASSSPGAPATRRRPLISSPPNSRFGARTRNSSLYRISLGDLVIGSTGGCAARSHPAAGIRSRTGHWPDGPAVDPEYGGRGSGGRLRDGVCCLCGREADSPPAPGRAAQVRPNRVPDRHRRRRGCRGCARAHGGPGSLSLLDGDGSGLRRHPAFSAQAQESLTHASAAWSTFHTPGRRTPSVRP